MAYLVDGIEVLRCGDLGFKEEGFAMRKLLRLQIELVGARGGDGRELFLERSHDGD